jgi:hypothetical protein
MSHVSSVGVAGQSSILFDVVLVDGNNDPAMFLKRSVTMSEALKLTTEHNGSAEPLIAVVTLQNSVECKLAPSIDSDASEEDGDSDVDQEAEDAAECDLVGEIAEHGAKAIRHANIGKREWLILVMFDIHQGFIVAPGAFTKKESEQWILTWKHPNSRVRRVKLRNDTKLYEKAYENKWPQLCRK